MTQTETHPLWTARYQERFLSVGYYAPNGDVLFVVRIEALYKRGKEELLEIRPVTIDFPYRRRSMRLPEFEMQTILQAKALRLAKLLRDHVSTPRALRELVLVDKENSGLDICIFYRTSPDTGIGHYELWMPAGNWREV